MSKKSLRTAVHLHERLLAGLFSCGSYGDAIGDDRKAIFNAKLLELEPKLKPCPFCGDLPVYSPSTLSHFGMCASGGGNAASISCDNCGLEFKGAWMSLIKDWNVRAYLK